MALGEQELLINYHSYGASRKRAGTLSCVTAGSRDMERRANKNGFSFWGSHCKKHCRFLWVLGALPFFEATVCIWGSASLNRVNIEAIVIGILYILPLTILHVWDYYKPRGAHLEYCCQLTSQCAAAS